MMNGNAVSGHPGDSTESNSASANLYTKVPQLRNYINGRFVPPVDGQYLDNVAPATSQILNQIPRSNKTDVEQGNIRIVEYRDTIHSHHNVTHMSMSGY